jgi:hypothetical protein
MPMPLINGVSAVILTVIFDPSTCSICPAMDAPEPAFMGEITGDIEKNTFAYDLLNDPDIVGPPPAFTRDFAHIGPAYQEEEKNSWAYRIRRAE